MARTILKINDPETNKDYYLEWSSVVDAPVSYGMSLEEFKEFYKEEYGREGMEKLDERLKRVEEKGTSSRGDSYEGYFNFNHAGRDGECIGKEQILEIFCRNRPDPEDIA